MRVWALVGTPGAGGVLKAHPGDVNPFVIWLWSLLIRFVVGVFLLTRPQLPRTHTRPHTRARTDTHTVDGCLSWPASTQTPPPFCSPVPPESLSLWEALEVIPGRGPPLYPLCGPLIHSLTTAWEKTMSFIIPFFSLFLFLAFSLLLFFCLSLLSTHLSLTVLNLCVRMWDWIPFCFSKSWPFYHSLYKPSDNSQLWLSSAGLSSKWHNSI